MYFTKDNALKIDIIRQEIEKRKNDLSIQEYNLLIKILLYASTKVGNISSTWGAYLKTFKKTALNQIVLDTSILNLLLEGDSVVHTVYNKDIIHLLNENDFNDTDIVYLDSPYNNRQYSSNYFVLEAISKYNNPEIKNGITGLLKETNEGSKIFCSKINAKKSFVEVLSKIKSKYLFISYSSDSIVSKADMIEILKVHWTNIICYTKEYKRFKSNNNGEQEATIEEYLFSATKL
jgi:adenine-specific DNA-methyltransferase